MTSFSLSLKKVAALQFLRYPLSSLGILGFFHSYKGSTGDYRKEGLEREEESDPD